MDTRLKNIVAMCDKTKAWKAGLAALAIAGLIACGKEPQSSGGEPHLRRLSQEQYRTSIGDAFGADLLIPGRFEPDIRAHGLVAVGASIATITPSGFEQYEMRARNLAAQIVSDENRQKMIPCVPKSASEADDACARQVIAKYGRLLFRRALTDDELNTNVALASEATKTLGNFYEGLQLPLASLMVSPWFLFRSENIEQDAKSPGGYRLDAYSIATRLSFFLWNTSPDDELLTAAESGSLNTAEGLQRQVDRMMKSPRYEQGLRAFFSDMLRLDAVYDLAKDPLIYPVYNNTLAQEIREQTLRTVVDQLLNNHGDYRDVFTSRKTFMTRNLGRIYKVPVAAEEGWEPYEFSADDLRRGLQTQVSFLALHSHPGRSSATLRGMALREILLCQEVPPAPANVNFTVVQETDNPNFKTARERLTAHRTDPACTGCHEFMDPLGLALENFDGVGSFRTAENGATIDPSGNVDGIDFQDSKGLGTALHELPQTSSCLVDRIYSYGVGREIESGEREWMKHLQESFTKSGFVVPDLMKKIALSKAFYSVSRPGDLHASDDSPVNDKKMTGSTPVQKPEEVAS